VDAGDVLRAMPGVSTRESPQNAGLAINIRGFEGLGRVNMMIDGVRQNFKFTGHEAQGFVYVDPALLAGIDVARGAVSTAGGAGALAGAANMRTLDVEDILKPGKSTGTLSTVTYGTNGVGWQEMLAGAMQSTGVGIAGAISHREPGSYERAGAWGVGHQPPRRGLHACTVDAVHRERRLFRQQLAGLQRHGPRPHLAVDGQDEILTLAC
jgi:hemoglobin/transferrin/lactoferrin receptor protein